MPKLVVGSKPQLFEVRVWVYASSPAEALARVREKFGLATPHQTVKRVKRKGKK